MSKVKSATLGVLFLGGLVLTFGGCRTVAPPEVVAEPARVVIAVDPSKIVDVPIVVTPTASRNIPKNKSIVIAEIEGPCASEVKTALMRRLIDNTDYDVLTRDNLHQILDETKQKWTGAFNTKTGEKIGNLMAASLFIVGEVHYCGASLESFDSEEEVKTYNILGTFQIIDLGTSKVLASSSSEGVYTPRQKVKPDVTQAVVYGASAKKKKSGEVAAKLTAPSGATTEATIGAKVSLPEGGQEGENEAGLEVVTSAGERWVPTLKPETYHKIKVADDMANGFADKFFARSTWESVEMWRSPLGKYGDSLRQVRLGQCPLAVKTLEAMNPVKLYTFHEVEFAEYLHNLGVALLCANRSSEAAEKFRSSYRVGQNESTLKMLGLANKVREWSLNVEVDTQSEIGILVTRGRSPL